MLAKETSLNGMQALALRSETGLQIKNPLTVMQLERLKGISQNIGQAS